MLSEKRDYNLDILRVISYVMVIVLHVSSSYCLNNIDQPNLYFTIGNFSIFYYLY